jgi:hypothetical protein
LSALEMYRDNERVWARVEAALEENAQENHEASRRS